MIIGVNTRMLLPGIKEGITRYIHETVARMVTDHPEDTFHFYFDRPYESDYIYGPNVVPHILPPPARHPWLWKIWFDYLLPWRMQKDGIDVLYTGDGYASLRTHLPQLMVSHDLAFEHYDDLTYAHHLRYLRKYANRFHQTAKSIIAVSQTTKQDIIDTYGIVPSKIKVAGNSTSMKASDIKDKSVVNGSDYFIYIGSLNPRKNIVRMIAAFDKFKEAHKTDHKLVIVGRLAWKSEQISEALTKATFNQDIIHIQDKVSEVNTLISNASALVYPSLFEGFGIPILEGFACDTPVITSNIGSMAEVAQDAAIKINPLSIDEMANAFYQVTTNTTIRENCVILGRKRLSAYSWDNTAMTTYQELINLVKNV